MDRYKKTAYIFGRRSDSRYGIFRLCSGNGLCQQTVSAARCAGIDAQASQGVQPLVRNKVTQKTARTFGCPGCLPRRAHILPSGEYRSAPFVPKGFFITHTVLPHIVSQILLGNGHRSAFAAPQRCRQSERTASEVPHPTAVFSKF